LHVLDCRLLLGVVAEVATAEVAQSVGLNRKSFDPLRRRVGGTRRIVEPLDHVGGGEPVGEDCAEDVVVNSK
jgi:hypothetical protein